jgi:threonylcarbamoyladenosine tRNA methylthiotransferase MtaB
MRARSFHTITLGCKLNQFDGAAIEGELARRGLQPTENSDEADVVVINTCTVTHRADADARKLIRRVRRANSDCTLLVTGCYAERDAASLHDVGGVDRVFGNTEKSRLPEILDELGIASQSSPTTDRGCDAALDLPDALHFGERSRAFLKIQEGCRLVCSYCVIPRVRGPSRSVSPERVLRAAASLFARGYREIVLTGVNTGDYGRDLDSSTDLSALLRMLLASAGPNRIRLNSLEPLTVTDEIIDLMASDPRLAPHLQIPLQSGADTILRRMRRNYTVATYADRLARVRSALPHVGLGADVIVGFPGETPELFEESYRFIESAPLDYLHVFSWSPRPGTPAATLDGRVPERLITQRSAQLRELGRQKARTFARRFVGRRLDAVLLNEQDGGTAWRALTGNYIELTLPPGRGEPGAPVDVRIVDAGSDEVRGVAEGQPSWSVARVPSGAY